MLLLHICCAPCGAGCVEKLLASGEAVTLYYSNSNLANAGEFGRRLEPVRRLAALFKVPLEVDPYDHPSWLEAVRGLENEPERGLRCPECFAFSLSRASQRATELQCRFATTLTVSPCKSTQVIFKVGSRFANFEPIDFKKGGTYQRSCQIVKREGYYRQRFCGCEFSMPEAGNPVR